MRAIVETKHIIPALDAIETMLYQRLAKHGPGAFVSDHEALGVLVEEYDELIDAIRANDPAYVRNEWLDVAVVALFALAGMEAKTDIAGSG